MFSPATASPALPRVSGWATTVPARFEIAIWALAAVFVFGLLDYFSNPARLLTSLGDTDDATRLIEVRDFLGGAPWFDLTVPQLGGAQPLVSHWSRLIDAPIAMLMSAFDLVLPTAQAELATRIVWPMLLLLALLTLLAGAAKTYAGRPAAIITLALAITCFTGMTQFGLGRIDHHNAQILGAVAGILFLVRAFDDPRAGWLSGVAFGLGTAVGMEAILLTAATLALGGLVSIGSGTGREGIARAGLAFALTLAAAFVLTTDPSAYLAVKCDELSLNLVLLAIASGATLAFALTRGASWPFATRLGCVALGAAVGLALYGFAEPACLAGPFGQVDPAVKPIWLDHVRETKNVIWLFGKLPIPALVALLHLAVGLACTAALWRTASAAPRLYAAVFVLAALLSLWQIKLMSYAALLAILPIAVWIARLKGSADVSPLTMRAGAVGLLNQNTLLLATALLIGPVAATEAFKADNEAARKCSETGNVRALASLPAGLAVADTDLGPYIAALTPLHVLSAPYHRLDRQIIATHDILRASTPEAAEAKLRREGAIFVIVCETGKPGSSDASGLQAALRAGRVPGYLEPVAVAGETPLKVWRVRAGR